MYKVSSTKKSIRCDITLPSSKSIINRLLVINHLSGGKPVNGLELQASDIVTMQSLLAEITNRRNNSDETIEINVGNAGTVMRFLTAVLAVTDGNWLICGTERMHQRPIRPLTDALLEIGAELSFVNQEGYPPVKIRGNSSLAGGKVQLNAGISSQFISALMMIAPLLKGGLEIEMQGEIISGSYIRMTQNLMRKAGAGVEFSGNRVLIGDAIYHSFDFTSIVEPDWSAAAFWYQVAAFSDDAHILLRGLKADSVQGDSILPELFSKFGVHTEFSGDGVLITKPVQEKVSEFNFDFTDCPDLAQAVIVTCAALGIQGRFSGLKTLRVKETDRIAALERELTKLGYYTVVVEDQILLSGKIPQRTDKDTSVLTLCYDDHRMAMSFAPLALLHKEIRLDEPEVVRKSYPAFWRDMMMAGLVVVGD